MRCKTAVPLNRGVSMSGLAILVWLINVGISWWNARVAGLDWVESKHLGGWIRFMTWMGWLMSALGFTWCYIVVLALLAKIGGYIDEQTMDATISLGYLLLLPGALISGLFIWIDSLILAWRKRYLPSIGIAAWNTFAQVHNTYAAIRGVGGAAKSVGSLFRDTDPDDIRRAAIVTAVLIVVTTFAGGFITTEIIRRHYAASRPLPTRAKPQPA
jgi:hypothetical protein